MVNICFNVDCDHWGEDPWRTLAKETGFTYGITVDIKSNDCVRCPYCNGVCPPHDNWLANERRHDNGAPVIE